MTASSLQRLAWTIWAISLATLAGGGLMELLGALGGQPFPRSMSDLAPAILAGGTEIILATLGALIVSRQARHAIGWIFSAVGLLVGLAAVAGAYATVATALPGVAVAASLGDLGQGPILFGVFVFVFLLFPDGRLPSPRWRWVAWTAATALLGVTLSEATLPGPLQDYPAVRNPFGIGPLNGVLHATFGLAFWVLMLTLVASAASLVLRFRRSRGEERQQLKWVASATGLAAILLLSGPLFWLVLPPNLGEWWPAVFFLAVAMILLAIGVAMLKYRLYDIDLLINRTLVYGGLTIGIVGLYVLVVGYLGNVLRTGNNNLGISLLATGVVAVLFQPLRERLQRGVNHLMYGERDDPYAVVSRLGQRLEGTLSPEALLPTIVETVAQALKLPYVAIALKHGDGYDVAAAAGRSGGEPMALPLVYQREAIGNLLLSPRAAGESFSPADHRLLADLARQASIAAHAVRLTDDLQRSRERLVAAREEERRRLRRDLHDGLGPSLAAQTLKVGSARALYPHDPAAADALLAELEGDMEAALANVRRLVYNLRPPALDELGLVGAIRDGAAQYQKPAGERSGGLSIRVDAPDDLPDLPAAVEVAAYRIAQEALTNVLRHAGARSCRIGLQLSREGDRTVLDLTIVDDGSGLPAERKAGVGLASMRERAAELGGTLAIEVPQGGGTSVRATLPLPPLGSVSAAAASVQEMEEAGRPLDTQIVRPERLARR